MPTLKYLDVSYDCATAIKGSDYIHLLDENGKMITAFDGISSFSGFSLENGSYTSPTADTNCHLAVVRADGTFGESEHTSSNIFPVVSAKNETDDMDAVLTGTRHTTVYLTRRENKRYA